MTTPTSLNLVIRVATDRRDGAAVCMAASRRHAEDALKKLEMLAQYRTDYLARMNAGDASGNTDPVRMSNIRAFLDKLEHAVGQQQRELDACTLHANACQQVLNADEMKLKSLEMLRDKRAAEGVKREKLRDQKRNDEFGARAAKRGGAFDYHPA